MSPSLLVGACPSLKGWDLGEVTISIFISLTVNGVF